jgi:hypothetical protein
MEAIDNEIFKQKVAVRKIWRGWLSFIDRENEKYWAARKKEEEQEREKRNEYFWRDGSCKNHDRDGCRECRWIMNGYPEYNGF